jgi:hypothetical protein
MASPMFPIPREWQDGAAHMVALLWWHFLGPHSLSKGFLKWNTNTYYMLKRLYLP